MSVSPHKVAQRFLVGSAIDHLVDVFLSELAGRTRIDEKTVDKVLKTQGISPEDINSLDDGKQAGDFVKALGGLIKKGLWYATVRPFLVLGKVIKSPTFRQEVKATFRKEVSHEVRATRHMMDVLQRMAGGESVKPQERNAALRHLSKMLTQAVLIVLTGSSITNPFVGGVWRALGALAAPLHEILLIILNKPLQAAASKLLTTPV